MDETIKHIVFWGVCLVVWLIVVYQMNKHYCDYHINLQMKSCKLIDGYYHIEFKHVCKVCNKIHGTSKTKIKKIKL